MTPSLQNVVGIPNGPFSVIYADPPWRYSFSKSHSRDIENQYPTMTTEDLCSLTVPAAENSVLYLWATAPKLEDALRVVRAWGFTYKTHAAWDKGSAGIGYWFRGQHEILIVATRGSAKPPKQEVRCGSVLRYPQQSRLARINGKCNAHSRKPWEVRKMIERWFPDASRLEMFARETVEGWTAWGNEVPCKANPSFQGIPNETTKGE